MGCVRPDAFQSTLPARGATRRRSCQYQDCTISIHAPRTGSDVDLQKISTGKMISIHAPRTGSDIPYCNTILSNVDFNPRSPHGERRQEAVQRLTAPYFNPRSPHGERLSPEPIPASAPLFQSTLPARGATRYCRNRHKRWNSFQSTLPARGATSSRKQ